MFYVHPIHFEVYEQGMSILVNSLPPHQASAAAATMPDSAP